SAFGRFASGITVVTALDAAGRPHGATVSAFTAVSMDPPLAQVTLHRGSRAAVLLDRAPFAINVLAVRQRELAEHFSGRTVPEEPAWRLDRGMPVLEGNVATFECRPWNIYDGGDHIIVVGEIERIDLSDEEPLLVHRGRFRGLTSIDAAAPWEMSADGPEGGWFSGGSSFAPFGRGGAEFEPGEGRVSAVCSPGPTHTTERQTHVSTAHPPTTREHPRTRASSADQR
ncbi:flavin reductase family protein, partial [Leucobacter sp. M11]|uniref:flavin reductase family protein n=1 Tax=Leucobacter sp. M11 TaxID=2993565 RepID=UPI002D80320D